MSLLKPARMSTYVKVVLTGSTMRVRKARSETSRPILNNRGNAVQHISTHRGKRFQAPAQMPKSSSPALAHKTRSGRRQGHHDADNSSIHIPLPDFRSLPCTDGRNVVEARVLPRPRFGKGTTWTVDEKPDKPVRRGAYVTFRTPTERTAGLGRISAVTDLRRHWVTFAITGATLPCNIRLPISWAKLDDLERYTHRKYYFDLPPDPRPHESLRDDPRLEAADIYPYDVGNPGEEGDANEMEERVAKITNCGWPMDN